MGASGPEPSAPGAGAAKPGRRGECSSQPPGAHAILCICFAHRVPRPFPSRVGEVRKRKSEFLRCNRVCPRAGRGGREGPGGAPWGSARGRRRAAQLGGRGRPPAGLSVGLECSRGAAYFVLGLGEGAAGAELQGPWDLEDSQLSVPRVPSPGVGWGVEGEELSSSQAGQLRGTDGTPRLRRQPCHPLASCFWGQVSISLGLTFLIYKMEMISSNNNNGA